MDASADNQLGIMNDELAKIRELAQDRLDALQEPPWATRRYQHLVALLDEMLAAQPAAIPGDQSLRPQEPRIQSARGDNVVPIARAMRRRTVMPRRLPM
jgi:hypothetical protein